MYYRIVLSFALSILLISCTVVIPENDIPGIWKSNDGATISFKDDHTCIAADINGKSIFGNDVPDKMTFTGTWYYSQEYKTTGELVVCLVPDLDTSRYHTFYFFFSGTGFFENSKPYHLFLYMDIDSLERYEFYKTE